MTTQKLIISIILCILTLSIVSALDFNPAGNITGKSIYSIKSMVNIHATRFFGNGAGLTNVNTTWNFNQTNEVYTLWGKWFYNMSDGAGGSGSTYNATYDTWAYNQTTDTNVLYGKWWYNMTTDVFNLYNATWDNSFVNKWAYNQTTDVNNLYGKWFYNQTADANKTIFAEFGKWWYNMTYTGGFYNATYAIWSYNQTFTGNMANQNLTNTHAVYYVNSTGTAKWKTFVNTSGSMITIAI